MDSLIKRTFFQQKWTAKAMTRAYHGEHIKEGQWERMFSRRLQSVVNMDPKYMAMYDGSEQATGRGSGKDVPTGTEGAEGEWDPAAEATNAVKGKAMTPYMQMAFAPMERRLDIAIFRALFASSARQARQFVVHGFVKVNGKKMIYPGYLLNPGDMFQVDSDRVMMATGRPKGQQWASTRANTEEDTAGEEGEPVSEDAEKQPSPEATAAEGAAEPADPAEAEAAVIKQNSETVKELLSQARTVLTIQGDDMSARQKQKLRSFTKAARSALSRAARSSATAEQTTLDVDQLSSLLEVLSVKASSSSASAAKADEAKEAESSAEDGGVESLTAEEREKFEELLRDYNENPIDPSKPYRTPWEPRKYMSPFAFIPRYLEVNQNICSAVYLRHPVARQGQAEVPTPFPEDINQLAFNWYLRRR